MTTPSLPVIDMLIVTACLIEFAIMYAAAVDTRPELRNGKMLRPTSSYMVGVGIIVLVFVPLQLVRASQSPNWSVPVFQFLFDLAAIIVAGGLAAFAHRKRHGEPEPVPPTDQDAEAMIARVTKEVQEAVSAQLSSQNRPV